MKVRQYLAYLTPIHRVVPKTFSNLGSQIGDERPVSLVRFAPNGETLATGSWSGSVKLWNVPACTLIRTLRGKLDHILWGSFLILPTRA